MAIALCASVASTQSRPDFSGRWLITGTTSHTFELSPGRTVVLGPPFSQEFLAQQDTTTVTLRPIAESTPIVIALDGSETRQRDPSDVRRPWGSLTPTLVKPPMVRSATWSGNTLVVLSWMDRTDKTRASFVSISLNAGGLLVLESRGQPTWPLVQWMFTRADAN
jgi:hypothetical protein